MTSGTVVTGVPAEIVIVTVVSRATFVPAGGSVLMTRPTGIESDCSCFVSTWKLRPSVAAAES